MMIILSIFIVVMIVCGMTSLYISYQTLKQITEFTNISKIMFLQYKLDLQMHNNSEAKIMTEDEYQEMMMEYELYGAPGDDEEKTKH